MGLLGRILINLKPAHIYNIYDMPDILKVHRLVSEAPAKQVGQIARAFKKDGAASSKSSTEAAAKVHEQHGERDCHRIFRRFNLSLRVPVSKLLGPDADTPNTPYIRIKDFVPFLLSKHPKLLLGGLEPGVESDALLSTFWKRYRQFQPEHMVFQSFGEEDWKTVIPMMVHGDKGRTRLKLPIFVFSFESALGLPLDVRVVGPACRKTEQQSKTIATCSCAERARSAAGKFPDCLICRRLAGLPGDPEMEIPHNNRGNTLLTRFLVIAIPSKIFKAKPHIVNLLLEKIRDLKDLAASLILHLCALAQFAGRKLLD